MLGITKLDKTMPISNSLVYPLSQNRCLQVLFSKSNARNLILAWIADGENKLINILIYNNNRYIYIYIKWFLYIILIILFPCLKWMWTIKSDIIF